MKIQIKKLSSSKLFYNKWPYKLECLQQGASKIIYQGVDSVIGWCKGTDTVRFGRYEDKNINKDKLLEFTNAVSPFIGRHDIRIRVEGSHFNLFCMSPAVVDEITNRVGPWVHRVYGPTTEEELKFMLDNGHKKILRDQLPYEKYKYRIFFKSKFPADKRVSFVEWADKYGDKLEISGTSRRWLLGSKHYAQDPFMYVEDDKMLSMAGIYLSGYVKKVEHFVIRSEVLPV